MCNTIISLAKLEVTVTREAIASCYSKAVTALAIAFGFNASLDKMATKHPIYFTLKDSTILEELTKHAGMTLDPIDPVSSFFTIFSKHSDHSNNHTIDKYSDDTMGSLVNAINGLIVNPWNAYFHAKLCHHQDAQNCK